MFHFLNYERRQTPSFFKMRSTWLAIEKNSCNTLFHWIFHKDVRPNLIWFDRVPSENTSPTWSYRRQMFQPKTSLIILDRITPVFNSKPLFFTLISWFKGKNTLRGSSKYDQLDLLWNNFSCYNLFHYVFFGDVKRKLIWFDRVPSTNLSPDCSSREGGLFNNKK